MQSNVKPNQKAKKLDLATPLFQNLFGGVNKMIAINIYDCKSLEIECLIFYSFK